MKQQSLRIVVLLSIVVCICAIIFTVFFINENKAGQENVTIANSEYYNEDKYAVHKHIIIPVDDKYSLADENGERVTEELYDVLSVANNGLYYFKQESLHGFINDELQLVFATKNTIDTNVSENFVIYSSDKKQGFINITTGDKIEAVYDSVQDFSEGMAAVQMGDSVGFINTSGELVIPYTYSGKALYQFKFGLCSVMTGSAEQNNRKAFYIDKTGTKVFDEEYDFCMPFNEGRAFVSVGGKWYIIDSDGNRVGENSFGPYNKSVPSVFTNSRAIVVSDGKYGIVDLNGDYVVQPKYELIQATSDNAVIFKQDGLFGYMDLNGSVYITARYEGLLGFRNGLGVFSKDNKYGVIDRAATVIVGPEYEEIVILDNGLIRVSTKNSEYIYVNKYGKIIYENNRETDS